MSNCHYKILKKMNLRSEGLFWLTVTKDIIPERKKDVVAGVGIGWSHCIPQPGSIEQCIPSLLFVLPSGSRTPAHGMTPPMFKVDLLLLF